MNILTPREKEIVALITKGLSNKHICQQLKIAEGTVKIHLHNIYTKLGVSNRTTLAIMALKTESVADKLEVR
jgi:DNA-binding NarL/FixJ family response regulator